MPSLLDSFSMQSNQQKRRIKAPESLKSPLAEWSEPVEDWRSLITDDILVGTSSSKLESRTPVGRHLPNERRHTMNMTDLESLSANLASFNIFSGFGNEKNMERKQSKVSVESNVEFNANRPQYLKSGPGYYEFSFVSMQELIQVICGGK